MKHMFSAFPGGLPGLALLALRGSVAVSLVLIGWRQEEVWLAAALYLLAGAVAAGLWTRFAAGAAILVGAALALFDTTGPAAMLIAPTLDAVALVLIGAGAWSVDARLFGRRTVYLAE